MDRENAITVKTAQQTRMKTDTFNKNLLKIGQNSLREIYRDLEFTQNSFKFPQYSFGIHSEITQNPARFSSFFSAFTLNSLKIHADFAQLA